VQFVLSPIGSVFLINGVEGHLFPQCFDTVGWMTGRAPDL